jgi:hypothetical protein
VAIHREKLFLWASSVINHFSDSLGRSSRLN